VLLLLLITPAIVVLVLTSRDSGPTVQRLRVGSLPTDVAASPQRAWVASARENRLVEVLDVSPPRLAASHETGSAPLRVAADAGTVWSTAAADDTVTWVDLALQDDTARRTAPIGSDAVDVAVGPDGAWVSNGARGTVTRIDAISHERVGPPIRTGRFPTAIAVGDLYVWVVNSGDGTVARIDPREHLVVGRRTFVGRDPQDIVVAAGAVWVANRGAGTVVRLSSRTGRPLGKPIRVGGAPVALAPLRDGVLVLDSRKADVLRIAAATSEVRRVIHVGGTPSGLAVGDRGSIWITDARAGTVTRVPPAADG
jgi:DNA-binding beta-propeller fold protein YncE